LHILLLGDSMSFIGIIGRRKKGKRNSLTFNQEVIQKIQEFHAIPVGILVDFEEDSKKEFEQILPLLQLCDGFILQGGSEYYDIDILIIKYAYENNISTLGICLGMQTMAMTFGGIMSTIGSSHNKDFEYVHDIEIIKDSKLYNIIQRENIPVNSRHKDYIVSTNLFVSARSNVIEAIEATDKDFFIGVQWHPESLKDENTQKLFTAFFNNVKK